MKIGLATACWGDYWQRFGAAFVAAIESMSPRFDDVVIVSDLDIDVPDGIRVVRPRSTYQWDWFNESAEACDCDWLTLAAVDDPLYSDALVDLDLRGDLVGIGCISGVVHEYCPGLEHWERMLDVNETAIWTPGFIRREVCLRFPWRQVFHPDWMQWLEIRYARLEVSFDPKIRLRHLLYPGQHSAHQSLIGNYQVRVFKRMLATGDVVPGPEWPPIRSSGAWDEYVWLDKQTLNSKGNEMDDSHLRGPHARTARTRGDGLWYHIDPAIGRSDIGLVNHEDWIFQYVPTGKEVVIVDAGAFVGSFAMWCAKRCKRVIAFEPMRSHFELLLTNLQLNAITNVDTRNVAVGDRESTVAMHDRGFASLVSQSDTSDIRQVTLDEQLADEPRIDLLKIDVEGCEVLALSGAREIVRKHRPRLLIEVHSHYDGCEHNGNLVAGLLAEFGYSHRRIFQNTQSYYYLLATPK